MSNNPCVQVGLAYVRRPFSSFYGILGIIGLLGMMAGGVFTQEALSYTPFGIGTGYLYFFLVLHIRQQFMNPHLHLVPGFRRVHLVEAALMAIIAAVLLPLVLFYWAGVLSVGHISITVLMFSAVLWLVLNPLAPLAWLLGLGCLFLLSGWWPIALEQLCSGSSELMAFALLVFGAATIVLGGERLARLTEDSPEYSFGMEITRRQGVGHHSTHVGILHRQLRNPLQERRMAGLMRHAQRASISRWSRICRWQVAMPVGVWIWCVVLCVLLFAQVMWWLIDDTTLPNPVFLLLYISLYIAILPFISFWARVSNMQHELLLPITRKQYIRQLGAAMVLCHLQVWAGAMFPLTLWAILVSWQYPPGLLSVIGLSAAFHVFSFGMAVWLAVFRSQPFGFLLGTLAVPISVMMVMCLQITQLEGYVMISAAVLFTLTGIMLTYAAYRRWLVADLD